MYTGEEIRKAQEDRKDSILKSFNTDIEKAKSGTYADTSENKRLNRVGQKYGGSSGKDSDSKKTSGDSSKNESGAGKSLDEHAKNSSDAALERAAKGSDEKLRVAAKKELERRQSEHVEKKEVSSSNKTNTATKTAKEKKNDFSNYSQQHLEGLVKKKLEPKHFEDMSDGELKYIHDFANSNLFNSLLTKQTRENVQEWFKSSLMEISKRKKSNKK